MSKTILVTGGAGYIGSHMVRMLDQRGFDVVVYDNLERGNRDAVTAGVLIEGDLHDTDRLNSVFESHDIEAVMHFAALAYVGESVHEPALYYRNNVTGTQCLLDTMRAHQVNKLVFSSTCATYGVPENLPITEATPQNPINPYGQSKLMVEQILKDYSVAYGFRSVALRYFNAAGCAEDGSLGERHDPETHLLPLILFEALRVQSGGNPTDTALKVFGNDFDTRDGTCVRDYIHVNDLCSAHIAAFERMLKTPDLGAEQFNLGVNRGYTVLEIIDACREVTGVDFSYNSVARRAGDPPELVADASRAMSELQWSPVHADVKESIQHAWNWFSAHPPAN
ncbi:UDP-glucose 4-epimerase GalE [Granulosicoccus antarcticus]|uniref:UDP-glucose 4-epimerase n=1 Tax=Granulosicoccus antarcticus IMCC3135 TaxID=1192854 RepID=A0A2Z2NMU1_9GAMM|nr:UDP-glucose 4-epimerase [Granulosicoccus antarcticus IMCC3135]